MLANQNLRLIKTVFFFFFLFSSLWYFSSSSTSLSSSPQFFTDPCASSPCLHGNCSWSDGGGGEEAEGAEPAAFTCQCTEGYEGERCDRLQSPPPPSNDTTTPTQSPAPPDLPTLLPWRPRAGQRLLVVPWEAERVRQKSGGGTGGVARELTVCVCVCDCATGE